MKRTHFVLFVEVGLAVLACCLSATAQVTSSSITGYVYDMQGRVIRSATVSITDLNRSAVRTIATDDTGSYRFVALAPSSYVVRADAKGFANAEYEKVMVQVESQYRLDFHLRVAPVNETVRVSDASPQLRTESTELGGVLDQQLIEVLPLNARNFLDLALLIPGVAPPVENSSLSTRGAFAMHANGGREEFNDFLLDGADNNNPYVSGYAVQPPLDSIQEFKIATSGFSAEYGRSGSGQVNVITRRGTNQIHGSVFDYLRNSVLDARNYFATADKPGFIRNQFGGTVGGPIRKDSTFFFADTDFLRQRGPGISQLATVPTEADRSSVPAADVPSVSQHILALYPLPNVAGTLSGSGQVVNNYLGQANPVTNESRGSFRVDHQFRSGDSLNTRYSFAKASLFEPYTAECSDCLPGFGDSLHDFSQNVMVNYQHLFGVRTVNNLTLAFNRFSRNLVPQNASSDIGSAWGVDWLNVPARDLGYPSIVLSGYSPVGDNATLPNINHNNTYQVGDSLALDRGSHLIKLGGEVRKQELNGHLDLYTRGLLVFSGYITGSGVGDLLAGLPTFTMMSQVNSALYMRSTSYAGYVQDAWKLRRNLTLNIGLRYEYNSPPVDPYNGMSELNLTTGQIAQVGTNGVTPSGFNPDRNNFAPRLGLAWNPVQDLIVRAGYGLSYDGGMFQTYSASFFNPPQFTLSQYFTSAAAPLTVDAPFPNNANVPAPATLSVVDPALVTPYVQQWNLAVEKGVGKLGTLTVAYAGSKGTHLIGASDLNQPAPGAGDLQSRRPYPQYANIFFVQSQAASRFDALQIHFTRRLNSGLSVWAAYTYSHSLDNASAFLPTTPDPNFPQNSHDPKAEWASSSFDMRQHLALAYLLTLPSGTRWTRDTQFQGIVTLYAGQPFTPMLLADNSNTGNGSNGSENGSDRPNLIGNPTLAHPTPQQWFNTSAFAIAAPYTFGNAGRNSLGGPGFASFDLSLQRQFSIKERTTLTLQAQAFNLFNRVNFDLPQAYADQPDFGTITSAKDPRQLQVAAHIRF